MIPDKPITEVIAELRELQGKATPLPWASMDTDTFYGEIRGCEAFELIAVAPPADDRPNDFAYIAFAANAAPRLADEIDSLREELKALRDPVEIKAEILKPHMSYHCGTCVCGHVSRQATRFCARCGRRITWK